MVPITQCGKVKGKRITGSGLSVIFSMTACEQELKSEILLIMLKQF